MFLLSRNLLIGPLSLMSLSQAEVDQIREQMLKSAGRPRTMTINGETYTGHSLAEMIAAYRLAVKSVPKKHGGLKLSKFVSGGPVA